MVCCLTHSSLGQEVSRWLCDFDCYCAHFWWCLNVFVITSKCLHSMHFSWAVDFLLSCCSCESDHWHWPQLCLIQMKVDVRRTFLFRWLFVDSRQLHFDDRNVSMAESTLFQIGVVSFRATLRSCADDRVCCTLTECFCSHLLLLMRRTMFSLLLNRKLAVTLILCQRFDSMYWFRSMVSSFARIPAANSERNDFRIIFQHFQWQI